MGQPNHMPYDFFISYARPDREQAESLYQLLAAESEVFVDHVEIEAGDLWQKKITTALQSSSVVVPVLSPNTKNAHFQISEILRAIDLARRDAKKHLLVPVLLDTVYDYDTVPLGLEPFQSLSVAAEGG